MTLPAFLGSTPIPKGLPAFLTDRPAVAPEPEAKPAEVVPEPDTGPAIMKGTDGKLYNVPRSSVAGAMKHGWREAEQEDFAHETKIKDALADREKWKGVMDNPITESLGRIGNEAAFGIPDYIASKGRTKEQNDFVDEVRNRQAAANPIRHALEIGAGLGVDLLIPGVGAAGDAVKLGIEGGTKLAGEAVVKEAGASLMRKVAASAGKVAAEGAIYAQPKAAIQAAYGDTEQAAETMLWGVGLGGALGAGGRLIGEGAKAAVSKVGSLASELASKPGENGLTMLDDYGRKVMRMTDKQVDRLGPDGVSRIIDVADREGVATADPKKMKGLIERASDDASTKVSGHHAGLEEALEDVELRKHGPVPSTVAKEFRAEVLSKFPESGMDLHVGIQKQALKIEDAILSGGNEPSFKSMQAIKDAIVKSVPDVNGKTVKAQLVKIADDLIDKHMSDSAQKLFEAGEAPEKFADYVSQKERKWAMGELAKNFTGVKDAPPPTGAIGLGTTAKLGFAALHGPIVFGAAVADVAREHAMRAFMENKGGLLGKSVSYLRKAAADPASAPFLGGLMAKEGVSALGTHMDNLAGHISMAKPVARATTDVVSHLIGPTTGLSKAQQFDKLTATIRKAAAEPDQVAQRVGAIASNFSGTDPQLAHMVAQKNVQALDWLQAEAPKDPYGPQPFQRTEWKPTEAQQKGYIRKVEIALNPMTVWQHYQDGTLTRADRDTLKAVYPKTYDTMVSKILDAAHDPREPALSHNKRMMLSMFTGQPLDGGLKNLDSIQQAISTPATQSPQQGGGGPKPSSRPKMRAPSMQTDTTRRTYGGATK